MKAYDFNELLKELKSQGLEIAEENSKVLFDSLMNWLEKSADLSESPYDDMLKLLYPQVRNLVNEAIENINKADNE